MATELRKLQLDEVSIVDVPANKSARVVLVKRDGAAGALDDCGNMDSGVGLIARLAKILGVGRQEGDSLVIKTTEDDDVADEDLKKQLETLTTKVTNLEGERDAALAINAARDSIAKAATAESVDEILSKATEATRVAIKGEADARKSALKSAGADHVMKDFRSKLPKSMQKAFDEMDEKEREEFMGSYKKSASDPVAKALESATAKNDELAAQVAKLQEAEEIRSARDEFKDLASVVKLDEFVPRIVKMRKADKSGADGIVADFRALAKQAKDGALFKVLGRDGTTPGSAEEKIDKLAKAYRATHPDVTHAVAVTKVLEANPELYSAQVAEQNQSTAQATA